MIMPPLSSYLKIICLVLLAISINLPAFIVSKYLKVHQKSIRKEVKAKINAGLKDHELVRLSFAKSRVSSQIVWHKPYEFEYESIMYDVVRYSESSDSIIYMCWEDNDESLIKQKLIQLSNLEWSKDPKKDKQKERRFDYYKNLICSSITELTYCVTQVDKTLSFIAYESYYLSFLYTHEFGPPPEKDSHKF